MSPSLTELGTDLLATTTRPRRIALSRRFTGMVAFGVAAWMGLRWLTP